MIAAGKYTSFGSKREKKRLSEVLAVEPLHNASLKSVSRPGRAIELSPVRGIHEIKLSNRLRYK